MRSVYFGVLSASLILAGPYVQPATAGPLPYIAGLVLADGSQGYPSRAYTVEHAKPGKYVIHLTGGLSNPADCIVTPIATQPVIGLLENKKKCALFFEDASGNPVDTIFNFFAVPMTK